MKNLKTSEVYKLFGKPDFIREEANSLTWQYREEVCVLDFFHTKNSSVVTFSDLRSRAYGENLKTIDSAYIEYSVGLTTPSGTRKGLGKVN